MGMISPMGNDEAARIDRGTRLLLHATAQALVTAKPVLNKP
jgi:hypothetical protein